MRQSRDTSPMPSNIDAIKNSLPINTKLYLYDGNINYSPMRRFFNGIKWAGKKLIQGGGIAGGLYGAYKLGQHKDAIINKFHKLKDSITNTFNAPRNNYTRTDA